MLRSLQSQDAEKILKSTGKGSLNDAFQSRVNYEDIRNIYHIGKEIGCGKFGIVRLVAKKSYDRKKFALKSIPIDHLNSSLDMLQRELEILMEVDHPNVISFHEIYMD